MYTPWGKAQQIDQITPGVYEVSTASHGGLLITQAYAKKHLSAQAIAQGEPFGDSLAYEEDCAWQVPAFELPTLWPALFATSDDAIKADPGAYLLKTLSLWQADYLLARGVTPDPENYQKFQARAEEDALRLAKDADIIISASSGVSWDPLPVGVVRVRTADMKNHLVTAASYRVRTPNRLSACTLVSAEVAGVQ